MSFLADLPADAEDCRRVSDVDTLGRVGVHVGFDDFVVIRVVVFDEAEEVSVNHVARLAG